MNILLTGGSGFIGKNILESLLSEKYNILAPAHSELDLLDENQVKEFFQNNQIDIVIHSATKPGHRNAKDTSNIFRCNTTMFFNLTKYSDYFDKLIFLSSGAVYDTGIPLVKVKEDDFDNSIPSDEHGFSKYICTKHSETVGKVIELRIFGIFGKYEDYAIRFISNAICKTLFDMPITIKQNRKFDYLYINDLMPVLDYFIQNRSSHSVYNVTPDKSVELLTLAEFVKARSGKNLPIKIKEEEMGMEYSGDNSRLREEIADLHLTPIEKAISELYNWYSDNMHLIEKEKLLFDK